MARNRGIKLPDAGDVPTVGIASDPGLRIPDLSGGIERGVQTLAGGVDLFGQKVAAAGERQKKMDDALALQRATLDYRKAAMTEFQRRQAEDDPARPDFTTDFDSYLETKRAEVMGNLPEGMSEFARGDLDIRLQDYTFAIQDDVGRLHLDATRARAESLLEEQTNMWSAQASRSPDALDGVLTDVENSIGDYAGALSPDAERKARAKARASVIESAVFGLVDKGRLREARAILADTKFDNDIDPSRRNVMGNAIEIEQKRLEVEAKQRAAEQKALYLTGYEDYVAFLQSGGTPDGRYSRGEILRVVGAEHGVRLADQVDRATAFGDTYRSVEFATPEELNSMLTKEQADLGKPEDFRTEAAELSTLAKAVEQRNNRLLSDPALFAQGARPVEEARTVMQANPTAEATAAYAAAAEAEQMRLGLRSDQVRYLTETEVDNIAARFQTSSGETAAQISQGLAEQWGSKWPQIYSQLSSKLPSAAVVIGSGMSPAASAALAEASRDPKVLRDAVPSDVLKDTKDAVANQLSAFGGTVVGQPGGVNVLGAWTENTELLALTRVVKGDKPEAAARWAYAETVGNKYNEIEGTYRVPLAYDPDAIEVGTNRALATLLVDRPKEVDLPTSLMGLPEAETRQQFLRALQDQGYWVTAPLDRGLTLYAGDAAVTINGKPYTLTWAELLSIQAKGEFSRELEAQ